MRTNKQDLYLHEEIMLLALRDDKGTVELGSNYVYAMGGAIMAELLLSGRIGISDDKKKLVNIENDTPLDDPILDKCLERIASAKRRGNLRTWIQRFWNIKKLHHRVAAGLCKRGILRADEDTVLLIFSRKIYPELDSKPERVLVERLRKAIFTEAARVDARTVVLLSLANASGLLRIPFDKRELKKRKKRIDQIVAGEVTGKATLEVIQAVQAALICASIVPVVVATTTTS